MFKSFKWTCRYALFLFFLSSAARAALPEIVPGEVLVKFRAGSQDRGLVPELESQGFHEIRRHAGSLSGLSLFRLPAEKSFREVIPLLAADARIEYVQPNYVLRTPRALSGEVEGWTLGCRLHPFSPAHCPQVLRLTGTPKPPLKPRPSEVTPPSVDPSLAENYSLKVTHALEAWGLSRGSGDVIVGVNDTGIDYNHEDLAFNMWRNPSPTRGDVVGYDFLGNDPNPYDDDEMKGHGSHAAGIIGAVGGNGIGISGVNQRVSLMALKSFSAFGYGTTESVVAAIGYAIDHGAKIVSNSFASGKKDNPVVIDIIEKARAKGVLLFFAAGNSAADDDNEATADYPAGYHIDNIVAVASTDSEDHLASSSNYGRTTVLVGAPGVNIYSTLPGSKYGWESGTSMACPFAAGVAALIWAKNPGWDYLRVKSALASSVDLVPDLAGKTITGGRVNVLKGLQATD